MSANGDDNQITLYIKGGVGQSVGDCPHCQRIYMILSLKQLNFQVLTVDLHKPAKEYKDIAGSKKPPFLVDRDQTFDDVTKMAEYLDYTYNPKSLAPSDPAYNTVGVSLFGALAKYLKNKEGNLDEKLKKNVLKQLREVEKALREDEDGEPKEGPFLDGSHITLADCNLLPKLHHVKVAGQRIKGLEIPEDEFPKVHQYLNAWYESEVYQETKYDDSEVENGWRNHRLL